MTESDDSPVWPSKRLFVGLELPPSCRAALSAINPGLTGLRWLPEEQFHLTLSFLGEVEAPAEERLREGLGKVRIGPFYLPLRGIGIFDSGRRASVIWVGVGQGHPHLFALHRRIQDAILAAGLEPSLQAFHPHVTIGRANDVSRDALRPLIRFHAETEFGLVQVTGFALFSSVLTAKGAIHKMEMRWEL
jgi:2'-5' RNA ligase